MSGSSETVHIAYLAQARDKSSPTHGEASGRTGHCRPRPFPTGRSVPGTRRTSLLEQRPGQPCDLGTTATPTVRTVGEGGIARGSKAKSRDARSHWVTEDFPTRPSILHRDPRQDGAPSLTCKERILGALVAPRLGSTDRGRLWRNHRSPPVRAQSGNLGWVPKAPGPEGTCRMPQEGASGSSSLNDEHPLSKRNNTRLLLPCPLFLRAEGCRGGTSSRGPAGVGIPLS